MFFFKAGANSVSGFVKRSFDAAQIEADDYPFRLICGESGGFKTLSKKTRIETCLNDTLRSSIRSFKALSKKQGLKHQNDYAVSIPCSFKASGHTIDHEYHATKNRMVK